MTSRILVIEDEPLIRLLVAESLRDHGFEVDEANGGGDVDALIEEAGDRIDGLIVDVGLPIRQGDELARDFRARWPKLPIVVATATSLTPLREQFCDDVRVRVIGKPYNEDAPRQALAELGVLPTGRDHT